MSTANPSPRKFRGLFSLIFNAIILVSLSTPTPVNPSYVSDIPQPIYPENYANSTPITDPPLGVPSFSWSAVSGATKYRLQVDNDIGFNPPIVLNITTQNTAYTPASKSYLFSDGEWYWRVRVDEPATAGEWSEIMLFTKSWATDENRPMLISPVNDATLSFINPPYFSWTPVIGATKYRFQIAISQDGFALPIYAEDTLSTTIQPINGLTNGEYWWRVVPVDTADHLGTFSEIRRFNMAYGRLVSNLVPTLLEPADEEFLTFTPSFHWQAVQGAEHYRLEYTSDGTCDFSVGTSVDTRQTSYTPIDTFSSGVRFCWHVRVETGPTFGDWSDTRHFQKKWGLQPQLLTPTNLYQTGLYPLYSWTPVPGASRYKIDISDNPIFNPMFETYTTANTTYAPQTKYIGTKYYYWRVTPIDSGGELGLSSEVAKFQSYYNSTSPILIYPFYFYLPNDPLYYGEYTINPDEDRTIPYPIFIWHRVITPAPNGGVYAAAYRIQVDTTSYFNDVLWEYDTENTSATPINGNDFTPQVGQDYYWRVCVLDKIGGDCIIDSYSGWSQVWKARFDPGIALPPTIGDAPELLRPAHGHETVEATPLLEWRSLKDATQYEVEISRDAYFETPVISETFTETVNIPAYAPIRSVAQRSLGRMDYGTYYWHVRAYVSNAWGDWSEIRRFQIASQSEWRYSRSLGDSANRLLIGTDPEGDTSLTYDLTNLYGTQSNGYWFLGFNASLTSTNMTYVFYIDLDHLDGSGAANPPARSYQVSTIPGHQPEVAIYMDEINKIIEAQNIWVYIWNGAAWSAGQKLSVIGGSVYTSGDYIELKLPNTAIAMSQVTSSASLMLFSVNPDSGVIEDSVPMDPQVPGNAQLSRFTAVSDHMNLVSPPNIAYPDLNTVPSILPFYWDWPTGTTPSTPFAGSVLEVYTDPSYTNRIAEFHIYSDSSYFGENNVTLLNDIIGDNIYHWRVQPRYKLPGYPEIFGAWSRGSSFRRLGFTVQNLWISITWATPTFSWDMVEGANSYRLQVSADSDFGSAVIDQVTSMTSYTPSATLAPGNYFWRVQVIRYDGIVNGWSPVEKFSLTLPTPTGLSPDDSTIVHYAPTFCWDPLIKNNDEAPYEPILTAWKYHIQVSRDENFYTTFDSVDTINNCWTPTSGYQDGTYWWRVAMIDGNSRMGSYSSIASFIKQSPITILIYPISGVVPPTPTFTWSPVDGAATYLFEASLYSTFFPLYDSVETINTEFTPTKVYANNVEYFWRVAVRDRNGRQGPFTDASIRIETRNYVYLPLIKEE